MTPVHTLLSNTIHARQSIQVQSNNADDIPIAALIAPCVIGGIVLLFTCVYCLRRSGCAATQDALTNTSANYFALRRYKNNNEGVVRNDSQNAGESPPAYTSIPVPPPAYTPDQSLSSHARTDSDVSIHAENTTATPTRRNLEGPEAGKDS